MGEENKTCDPVLYIKMKRMNGIKELEKLNERQMARTMIDDKWEVSTISLVRFPNTRAETLFQLIDDVIGIRWPYETMVFKPTDEKRVGYGHARYDSREEAKKGHIAIVKAIAEGRITPKRSDIPDWKKKISPWMLT